MISVTESTFFSSDGKTGIFYRQYIPETEAKAIVQIAHGVAEYIDRYAAFAEYLAENGYIVVLNDHLGHGRSISGESELGFFAEKNGWEKVVQDMRTLHDRTAASFPGKPYFLFGHSMGSFLSRSYLIRYLGGLDGCILSGTGHQNPLLVTGGVMMGSLECRRKGSHFRSDFLQNMAFGSYNKEFEPRRTEFDWLSRDCAAVDAYAADPLCGYVSTAGLFRDMMNGIALITNQKMINRMKKSTPILFMSGDKDPVGENGKGVMRAYKCFLKAGMEDVTLKLYPGGRHEMLNELNKQEVYEDVLYWLDGKCGR